MRTALTLGFVAGVVGRELLAAGRPDAVLAGCGGLLRGVHETAPGVLPVDASGAGRVFVRGGFGLRSVLLGPGAFEVAAVVGWGFARLGDLVE